MTWYSEEYPGVAAFVRWERVGWIGYRREAPCPDGERGWVVSVAHSGSIVAATGSVRGSYDVVPIVRRLVADFRGDPSVGRNPRRRRGLFLAWLEAEAVAARLAQA